MVKNKLFTQCITFIIALMLTTATAHAANDYNLPSMGAPASDMLSPEKERLLGQRVLSQLYQSNQILEDEELTQYLQDVGQRLIQQSSKPAGEFQFFVVDDDSINAFALPGGSIGINSGLLTKTERESELAAVMAHEISHVTQRHIARQLEASRDIPWTTLAALLAAAIIGGGDAAAAAITGSLSMAYNQQVSFTRAHEFEADRVGITLLSDAGFDPNAMAGFFTTLQRQTRLYGRQPPQILLSHPVTSTRIAEAVARAKKYPNTQINESADYALMKERARVLILSRHGSALQYYRDIGNPERFTPAEHYGHALALKSSGHYSQAAEILTTLAKADPEQPYYVTALARTLAASKQYGKALAVLDKAQQHFSNSDVIALAYAQALLDQNRAEQAADYLKSRADSTHNAQAQAILAKASAQQNKIGEAFFHKARHYQLRLDFIPALRQLYQAEHSDKVDSQEKARAKALEQRILKECRQIWPDSHCA